MINNWEKLTQSQIKYLLTIKKLSIDSCAVKSIDIAKKLGLSKASVHTMIDGLNSIGLVDKKFRGTIAFTEIGGIVSDIYEKYYSGVKKMLNGFAERDEGCDNAIIAFISELSPKTLDTLIENK